MGAGGGEGDSARRACVPAVCAEGEGEREIMPEAMLGLPMDRRTVSRVRSILRNERVRISCFFEDLFPRLDSSKIHSWFPDKHLLHGGPCSAPTHFILSRLQTVHAREPRVGFALTSSFSAIGLCESDPSSFRAFFLLSFMVLLEMDDEGRFPLRFEEEGYIWSVGGVPIVSEP